jgi:hypothetical protein
MRSGVARSVMNDPPFDLPRSQADRRERPTTPLDALRPGGRRTWPRRQEERLGRFFVDRFDATTLAMIVLLLCLTIADGVLTIELLDVNSEEVNPLMGHLLTRGHREFLLGKYVMTAAGLPFLIVYKHYPMFGTRFRAGWLLHVFISLYLMLLAYQWALLHAGRPGLPAAGADPTTARLLQPCQPGCGHPACIRDKAAGTPALQAIVSRIRP